MNKYRLNRRNLLRVTGAGLLGMSGTSQGSTAQETSGGDLLWKFLLDDASFPFISSSPTVVDGMVYIGISVSPVAPPGEHKYADLYAVDATDGTEQWRFKTGGAVDDSPTVANGTVYITGGDDNVYAVDVADGTEQWRFDTGDTVRSFSTIVGGTVYIDSFSGKIYAVGAVDGAEQWQFNTDGIGNLSPTVVNGTVYVGNNDLYALNAAAGTKQWQFKTADDVGSSPTVVDGTVYFGTGFDGSSVYAVDATDGTKQSLVVHSGSIDQLLTRSGQNEATESVP